MRSLADAGRVWRDEGTGRAVVGDVTAIEVPDSVEAMLMSRLDSLDEASRTILQVASVVGSWFQPAIVEYALGQPAMAREIPRCLARIEEGGLVRLERSEPVLEVTGLTADIYKVPSPTAASCMLGECQAQCGRRCQFGAPFLSLQQQHRQEPGVSLWNQGGREMRQHVRQQGGDRALLPRLERGGIPTSAGHDSAVQGLRWPGRCLRAHRPIRRSYRRLPGWFGLATEVPKGEGHRRGPIA
jgi:hypothetical protein